jgi:hypothetical protein
MPETYRTTQVIKAANISRHTLDRWIAAGYFSPQSNPANGEAREYSLREVFQLAAMAELFRLGIGMKSPAMLATRYLTLRKHDDAYLVIWQGPAHLIPITNRGDPIPERHSGPSFYNPDSPPMQHEIVLGSNLANFLDDPNKRSVALVNLNHLERRILCGLENTRAE